MYGQTKGVYFPLVVKTYARNVSEEDLQAVMDKAMAEGWQNVRCGVEAF